MKDAQQAKCEDYARSDKQAAIHIKYKCAPSGEVPKRWKLYLSKKANKDNCVKIKPML